MPIYEYRCESCDHHLEKIQKVSDDPLVTCPQCGQDTLRKLISAPSFRLKGSGWYETDFKNSGKKEPPKKDNASETKTETKSETKKDTPSSGTDKSSGKSQQSAS